MFGYFCVLSLTLDSFLHQPSVSSESVRERFLTEIVLFHHLKVKFWATDWSSWAVTLLSRCFTAHQSVWVKVTERKCSYLLPSRWRLFCLSVFVGVCPPCHTNWFLLVPPWHFKERLALVLAGSILLHWAVSFQYVGCTWVILCWWVSELFHLPNAFFYESGQKNVQ